MHFRVCIDFNDIMQDWDGMSRGDLQGVVLPAERKLWRGEDAVQPGYRKVS